MLGSVVETYSTDPEEDKGEDLEERSEQEVVECGCQRKDKTCEQLGIS